MGAPILLASCLYAGAANARSYKWDTPPYAEDYAFITNDGGWCWFSDPRAIYVDNKIIGGFVDKAGSIRAFSYDPIWRLPFTRVCMP